MDVVDFDVAHFLESHVRLLDCFVVGVFLCNFAYSFNIFLFCLFYVIFLVFDVLNFRHLFGCYGSFADNVDVLEVRMVEE